MQNQLSQECEEREHAVVSYTAEVLYRAVFFSVYGIRVQNTGSYLSKNNMGICKVSTCTTSARYCIVLYLQPVLNPESYDGARVLEASGRPIQVPGAYARFFFRGIQIGAGTIFLGYFYSEYRYSVQSILLRLYGEADKEN